MGYSIDSRCGELKLPKTCQVIEVNVDERDEAKGISYFSTSLSTENGSIGYNTNLSRVPHLILDPNGQSVPIQNCTSSSDGVYCRTPVKMMKGKWKFIISSGPSKHVFKQEAIFENDVVKRRSMRRFFSGYAKLEFEAKSGPDEILLGIDSKLKYGQLEARMREPFSVLPKRPRMIFLLDTSWSANEKGIRRQIKLLKSIVKHTDDETIEVLAYNRFVTYFTINPNHVDRSLKENAKALGPKNGSNLEAALDKAQELTRKGNRPTRIFVMSDLKIFEAGTFEKEYVLDLSPNVVLHVIAIDGGFYKTALHRDDHLPFSRLARNNRGISVRINPSFEERFDRESLHLIRPARVEDVQIGGRKLRDVLEGETFFDLRSRAQGFYSLKGKLWQNDYVLKIKRTKKGDARLRRRMVMSQKASTKEIIAFGSENKVVTTFRSLVGIEKINADGRRPKYRFRSIGYGRSLFYSSTGKFHPHKIKRITDDVLRDVFKTVGKRCQRFKKESDVYAKFATTDFEIVSLRRTKGEKNTDWSRCIHEGIWDTKLPDEVQTGTYPIQL